MGKILVAYFSASGVTKRVAAELAKAAGADLYEIRPAVPYTKEDLDWTNPKSRSSVEMRDKSSRPAIADDDARVAAYDTVFVGFPIWWYTAPTIINTFLEKYDFSGKTVIAFATSGGSGFGGTAEDLKRSVAPSAVVKEGKVLKPSVKSDDLKSWIASLGL